MHRTRRWNYTGGNSKVVFLIMVTICVLINMHIILVDEYVIRM
jgi:hypothetical protein